MQYLGTAGLILLLLQTHRPAAASNDQQDGFVLQPGWGAPRRKPPQAFQDIARTGDAALEAFYQWSGLPKLGVAGIDDGLVGRLAIRVPKEALDRVVVQVALDGTLLMASAEFVGSAGATGWVLRRSAKSGTEQHLLHLWQIQGGKQRASRALRVASDGTRDEVYWWHGIDDDGAFQSRLGKFGLIIDTEQPADRPTLHAPIVATPSALDRRSMHLTVRGAHQDFAQLANLHLLALDPSAGLVSTAQLDELGNVIRSVLRPISDDLQNAPTVNSRATRQPGSREIVVTSEHQQGNQTLRSAISSGTTAREAAIRQPAQEVRALRKARGLPN